MRCLYTVFIAAQFSLQEGCIYKF